MLSSKRAAKDVKRWTLASKNLAASWEIVAIGRI